MGSPFTRINWSKYLGDPSRFVSTPEVDSDFWDEGWQDPNGHTGRALHEGIRGFAPAPVILKHCSATALCRTGVG